GASTKGSTFALRLTRDGEETPKIWSGSAIPTKQLIASRPGTIWLATAELSPVAWSGQLENTGTLATPFNVSIPAEGDFAVSSLLIGGGPESGAPADPLFAIGPALFRPRADAQFSRSESLWYFLQFRGALPEGTRLEPKLMKKGKGIVTAWQPFPPDLVAAGSNLQVAGYEVPLQTIEPGAYTLYVTIRAGAQGLVRRADFEVVER
ncbi:MAG TPA: hypothetical protein VLV48_10700, partial [Thermoanaerobaculia bacterium]|nr:hypothetical protein [Thermoanaerobaculia bacterium]